MRVTPTTPGECWDEHVLLDRASFETIKSELLNPPSEYTEEEDRQLQTGLSIIDLLDDADKKNSSRGVKMSKYDTYTPLFSASICRNTKNYPTYSKVVYAAVGSGLGRRGFNQQLRL